MYNIRIGSNNPSKEGQSTYVIEWVKAIPNVLGNDIGFT
jgi:hypothetical protein